MRRVHQAAVLTLALAVMSLIAGGAALAGEYHSGSGLHCTDCHVMHASKDGTYYNGTGPNPTGYVHLLKGASTNALCLSCHDGTDTTAPDLVATGTAAAPNTTLGIAYTSKFFNSAGFFQSDWSSVASNEAHNLGGGDVTAVQGTWTATGGMDCGDCHDPHGTANFRNLVLRPGGVLADVNVRPDTEVYEREAITIPATAAATATHYDTSAVGFTAANNFAAWCETCHTNIAAVGTNKHPQDQAVSLLGDSGAHWTGGTGAGFGTDVEDGTSGIPRVRFGQTGVSYAATTTVAATNTEFCLSCHKGHGSKYDSTLVWPYYTDGTADQTSACDQCHNKGA